MLDTCPVITITLLDRDLFFHLSDSIILHQALKALKQNAPVLLQKLIPAVQKLLCYFSSFNEVKWVTESLI